VTLLRRSCDLGSANGCMAAGVFLEVGDGVPQDLDAAAALYGRACEGGAGPACELQQKLEERRWISLTWRPLPNGTRE